jgi:hypothetical protein
MEISQMMINIITITDIMPTAAPALNIPVITEQLLSVDINKANAINKRCTFFIMIFFK